jgi:hypothetical protein
MTAEVATAGRCAHCGRPATARSDEGIVSCSAEHLLLARILEEPCSGPAPLESIARTRAEQLDGVVTARAQRRRTEAHHRLRSVCEDIDELLGQAAEAARRGDTEAAREPLASAHRLASLILYALRRSVPVGSPSTPPPQALDEDDIMAALALVEELDSQLRDAHIGYRGATPSSHLSRPERCAGWRRSRWLGLAPGAG